MSIVNFAPFFFNTNDTNVFTDDTKLICEINKICEIKIYDSLLTFLHKKTTRTTNGF